MHLLEMLNLRAVPAAGLFLHLTRRCPLKCEHCSTQSLMTSEQHSADLFSNLVGTFTPQNRPELILLTGGEALLRPQLVRELTEQAHKVGTKVALISGMFFAKHGKIAPELRKTILELDHFTGSLDIFHEKQVPRQYVFEVMAELTAAGKDVSFQLVGLGADDPYLADATKAIETTFNKQIPALVALVNPVGRATKWLKKHEKHLPADLSPEPCSMVAWPVVGWDGRVVACCNQQAIENPPPHLVLGQAGVDDWASLQERLLSFPMLRALRTFGPEYLAQRFSEGQLSCNGMCNTCLKLSDAPQVAAQVLPLMARSTMPFVEEQVRQSLQKTLPYGAGAYAHMLRFGYQPASIPERVIACAG